MSDGIAEMNRQLCGLCKNPIALPHLATLDPGIIWCYGLCQDPLDKASAALAEAGSPLVADSILTGAKQSIDMAKELKPTGVRTFDTGATRDTDEGKHDIEAFFSPLVTKRRAEYMHLHRKQSNGELRDGDNWQLGMPYNECLKSLVRHVEDIKLLSRGYEAREDIETAICAAMFNLESMLLTRLTAKENQND